MDSKLNRRAFLQAAATAAAGFTVGCTSNPNPWRFLRIDEALTLAAIVDQIIPPDQDPGASWAGVVNYIDCQLCGPYQAHQWTYRLGLSGVDQTSRALYGKIFAEIESQRQIELLHQLENAKASGTIWKQLSSSDFFGMVVDHTMQGFYGDPRHGGNREGVSWKMLGLPYPPIRGRLRPDEAKRSTG
jgi:gluconate 2-dehydrogenase gamma chain